MSDHSRIPASNSMRRVFRSLADRAFDQTQLSDGDLHAYLSDLLLTLLMWISFIHFTTSRAGA